MKIFLFMFLAGYAVKCDDSNYYVVQRPDDPSPFKVYWNVPTMQCKSKRIPFTDLYEKYGILQNEGDSFRGEKVSILYDPGLFPALLKNESSGQFKYRNGGVPQEGDLMKHLEVFKSEMEQSIPDKNFSGVGIIDFESWRPCFRQNFGVLTPYKDVSYEIEKQNHWWWKKAWIQAEAKRRFEESARAFMQTTLATAKNLRPHATWGYYGFPYCFNMANNNMKETCADRVPEENDGTYWLWSESTALYPSVYSAHELSSSQLASLIRGRVAEAKRVATTNTPIYPYFWFRYRNGGYFREKDLTTALSTLYKSNISGFIIWGSSNDVNTVEKCEKLLKYVDEILGPAVAKYTKNKILQDEYEETIITTTVKPSNTTVYDPEFVWKPPQNYTENIQEMVDEELKDKNRTKVAENGSILIDLILHSIVNYCSEDNCNGKIKKTITEVENFKENDTEASCTSDNCNKVRETTTEGDNFKENSTEILSAEGAKFDGGESRIVLITEDPFRMNKTEDVDDTEPTSTYTNNLTDEDYTEKSFTEGDSLESTTDSTKDYDATEYITDSTNSEVTTESNYSTNEPNTNNLEINEYQYTTESDEALSTNIDVLNSYATNSEATNSNGSLNSNNTELNSTTLAPILTNQVVGSASRPKLSVCVIFVYSFTKCLCAILKICS